MKSISLVLLCGLLTTFSFAQNNFQGKAIYISKTTMDMSRFDKMPEERKKQIMARMKNFLEKSYTLRFTKQASSFKENVKLEEPSASGPSWAVNNGQGSIYKNLKEAKMVEATETFGKRFLITENIEQPKWQLGSETKKIGQYTCYKATLTREDTNIDYASIFRRRKRKDNAKNKVDAPKMETIIAWYTPQIPISTGPKDYYGLPGLILEVNAGRTTMLCTEIVINPKDNIAIKKPKRGKKITRKAYNTIVKEKSEELRTQRKMRH